MCGQKSLTSSYLGVTGHVKDHCRPSVTLAVKRITGSHTATNIRYVVDEILSEWDIDSTTISAVLTDNCSNNIVAAFKESIDEEKDDDVMAFTSDDEQEFLDCEEEHYVQFISYNRISCFSHTLQLVVNKFDAANNFKEVIKHAHSIMRKFNSSTKATERLIAISGRKIIKDCPVRWSSTFLMINRMIEVKDHVKVVLD